MLIVKISSGRTFGDPSFGLGVVEFRDFGQYVGGVGLVRNLVVARILF